jgi:hypothetical protein
MYVECDSCSCWTHYGAVYACESAHVILVEEVLVCSAGDTKHNRFIAMLDSSSSMLKIRVKLLALQCVSWLLRMVTFGSVHKALKRDDVSEVSAARTRTKIAVINPCL